MLRWHVHLLPLSCIVFYKDNSFVSPWEWLNWVLGNISAPSSCLEEISVTELTICLGMFANSRCLRLVKREFQQYRICVDYIKENSCNHLPINAVSVSNPQRCPPR